LNRKAGRWQVGRGYTAPRRKDAALLGKGGRSLPLHPSKQQASEVRLPDVG